MGTLEARNYLNYLAFTVTFKFLFHGGVSSFFFASYIVTGSHRLTKLFHNLLSISCPVKFAILYKEGPSYF